MRPVPEALQLLIHPGRHGDIEDTLLTLMMSRAAGGKKFDKMSVARVYFGNWLRDYCKLVQGCEGATADNSQLKLSMSVPSNMSLRRLFGSCFGFWDS